METLGFVFDAAADLTIDSVGAHTAAIVITVPFTSNAKTVFPYDDVATYSTLSGGAAQIQPRAVAVLDVDDSGVPADGFMDFSLFHQTRIP